MRDRPSWASARGRGRVCGTTWTTWRAWSPRGVSETTGAANLKTLRQALAEASARRGVFEVWVTHMFVLNDLVGVNTASGEGLILQADASGAPRVLERLAVPI